MNIVEYIKNVISLEADAVKELINQIDQNFEIALDILLNCRGKIIVTGVGKSGHIGSKIAATLAGTGTPSFFLHSGEGAHGDLGMVENGDVLLLISNSGETEEVLNLIPTLDKIGCKKIALTSNKNSTLSQYCDVTLSYNYIREADHNGLAPTTSTTITLVIGDALAACIAYRKNFKPRDFHFYHPGGTLGKELREKMLISSTN